MNEEEKDYYTRLFEWRKNLRQKNYFEILDVEEDTASNDVKKTYMKLVKQCHPDTLPSDRKEVRLLADEIFTMLTKAHDVLSDRRKRREYVETLKSGGEGDATDEVAMVMAAEDLYRNGMSAVRRKDFEAAKHSFQEAIKLNPQEGEYYIHMGWAHFNMSPNDILTRQEAMKMIENGIELSPKFSDGYFYKASLYKAQNDIMNAYEWYQRTLEVDRKHARALSELRLMKMRVEEEKRKKKSILSRFIKN